MWLPIISVDQKLLSWCPQRLPELLVSTVPVETKMEEAANIANALANRFVADDAAKAAIKAM